MPDLFSVPVFFIVFRETLETSIIVSVLLAFLKQTISSDDALHRRMRRQVWFGTGLGGLICLIIAGAIVAVFYTTSNDTWSSTEYYYEGAFSLFASFIITITGAALLRINKMQAKWQVKLVKAIDNTNEPGDGVVGRWMRNYFMFLLPFITVLREGVEAVVFIAGVTFSAPPSSVPIPTLVGIAVGSIVGWIIYKTGSTSHLQIFLVIATCFLYLVAAALFTRAVWYFEQQQWNNAVGGDAAEVGTGPGSYDIDRSVWHVNCCSPTYNGGGAWGIFNGLLGWQNSATYGSVISYNLYWVFVVLGFVAMRFRELNGHWPLMKRKVTPRERSD